MSKMLSYEEVDKKQLVDWIELCHDLFDEKKVKDSEHGALYSVFGRLGIYVKENEARIAALESRLREAEAVIKPMSEAYDYVCKSIPSDEDEKEQLLFDIFSSINLENFRNLSDFMKRGDTNKV